MPACTPDRGNSTPTLRPAPCDLAMLKGATVATMPAPRPLLTLRRVTPLILACVLRLMRFLLPCASGVLGLPEYMSFARRASCPPGRRAAASHPRTRPGEGGWRGALTGLAGLAPALAASRRGPLSGHGSAPPGADQRQRKGWCGGGAEGDRTPDLVNAIHALSQLSYGPSVMGNRRTASAAGPPKYSAAGFRASGCLAAMAGRRLIGSAPPPFSPPLLRLVGLRDRAPDDVGHIRAVLLFFFEEGLVILARGRLVLALDNGKLVALRLGDVLRLDAGHVIGRLLGRPARGLCHRRSRGHGDRGCHDLIGRLADRTDDRVAIEIVEPRPAFGVLARALRAALGFRRHEKGLWTVGFVRSLPRAGWGVKTKSAGQMQDFL